MNEAKIRATLARWREADKSLVESWNAEFGWGRVPSLEDRIGLTMQRLKNVEGVLVTIGDALTEGADQT